jgi:hypothetical protein
MTEACIFRNPRERTVNFWFLAYPIGLLTKVIFTYSIADSLLVSGAVEDFPQTQVSLARNSSGRLKGLQTFEGGFDDVDGRSRTQVFRQDVFDACEFNNGSNRV